MFKHIMVPIDGSQLSMGAASEGLDLAKSVGAKVTAYFGLVTPATIMATEFGAVDAASIDLYEKQMKADAQRCFKALAKRAAKLGVELETVSQTVYDPAGGIMDTARKERCDLIVIGSHGRSVLKRMFLGSVAVRLLSQSKLPVLVQKDTRATRSAGKALLESAK